MYLSLPGPYRYHPAAPACHGSPFPHTLTLTHHELYSGRQTDFGKLPRITHHFPALTHIASQRLRVVAGAARLYPKLQSLSNEFSRATGIPIYFNFSSGVGTAGTSIRAAMAKAPPIDDTADGSGGYDAFIIGPSYLPQAS